MSAVLTAVETPVACRAPLAALAEPGRVRIVNVLATTDERVCVCELIEPLGLAQPTVSHLKKLLEAGLLEREQRAPKWAYSR